MHARRLLLGAGLLASLGMCTLALTGAAFPTQADKSAPATAGAWEVDATHSSALFKIKHMGVSWFIGRFNSVSGTIEFDPSKPEASTVLIKVDTKSVDTRTKQLDDHLKSPDFFDAAQFSEMVFESESVKKGKEKDSFEVKGNLTLHGVTKPLTTTVSLVGTGDAYQGEGKLAGFFTVFKIDRADFGMEYGSPDALGTEVEITLSLETKQG